MSTNGISVKARRGKQPERPARPWRSVSVRTPIVEMAETIGKNHVPKLMIAQVFEMALVEMAERMNVKLKKSRGSK